MWEPVIGLEVHVQLSTKSKIFSSSPTNFGAIPNSQASIIDLAYPGCLPVLNESVLKMAVQFGLAVQANIPEINVFARKNYFYPDLPKGYQISQDKHPIVMNGHLNFTLSNGERRTVNLTRAHLEEDAGKSQHEEYVGMSGVDLNRAGVPLLEIVSEPELRSAEEAVEYLKTLHTLVQYLDICDGNLQNGSFRCDANVSVRKKGGELGTRAEIKNVNSFRFVEKAINFEIERQITILEEGGSVRQETRLYDSSKNETRAMRSKEAANDYRYFPDPDLMPVKISPEFIAAVKRDMPELPSEKATRFQSQYQLSAYDAEVLTASKPLAYYYEQCLSVETKLDPKLLANWVIGDCLGALNKAGLEITDCPILPERLAGILIRITDQTISGKIAKQLFDIMWSKDITADDLIEQQGLRQVSDDKSILALIDEVIAKNPGQTEAYRAGKDKLFGFFVGQVMKLSQGKANPDQVNSLLKSRLSQN